MSAALLQACWRVYPARAGHLFSRSVKLPAAVRTQLLKSRRNKRSALEYGFLVENWDDGDIESMCSTGADMHHLLGIGGLPANVITRERLGRLAKTANGRFPESNLWAEQALRVVNREDLSPSRRRFLQYACPLVLTSGRTTEEEMWGLLGERCVQNSDGVSLHEGICLNSNVPSELAVAVLETFDGCPCDRFSLEGMRRLVAARGNSAVVIDALVIALGQFAKRAWPRAEVVMRELVDAPGFNEAHADYLVTTLRDIGPPIALCAWSGATESYTLRLVNSAERHNQSAAAFYAVQNPSLSPETLRSLANLTSQPASLDAWILAHSTSIPESEVNASVDRIVENVDGATLSELLCLPDLDVAVLVRVLDKSWERLQATDGVIPSPLMPMLAERESVSPEVWRYLADFSWRMSDDEKTSAIARCDIPLELSEALLVTVKSDSGVLAAALGPHIAAPTRAACLDELVEKGVSPDVAELIREHITSSVVHPTEPSPSIGP